MNVQFPLENPISSKIITVWRLKSLLPIVIISIALFACLISAYHFQWLQWITIVLYLLSGYFILRSIYIISIHPVRLHQSWHYALNETFLYIKHGYIHQYHAFIPIKEIESISIKSDSILKKFQLVAVEFDAFGKRHIIPGIDTEVASELQAKVISLKASQQDLSQLRADEQTVKTEEYNDEMLLEKKLLHGFTGKLKAQNLTENLKNGSAIFDRNANKKGVTHLIGQKSISDEIQHVPGQAIFLHLIQPSYLFVIITFFVFYFWPEYWIIPVLYMVSLIFWRLLKSRQTRYAYHSPILHLQSGVFQVQTLYTTMKQVKGIIIRKGFLEKRLRLASVTVMYGSNLKDHMEVEYVPQTFAASIVQHFVKETFRMEANKL